MYVLGDGGAGLEVQETGTIDPAATELLVGLFKVISPRMAIIRDLA